MLSNIVRVLAFGSVFIITITSLYTNKYQHTNLIDLRYQAYISGSPIHLRFAIYLLISAIMSLLTVLLIDPVISKLKKMVVHVEWESSGKRKSFKLRQGVNILLALTLFVFTLFQLVQLSNSTIKPWESLSLIIRRAKEVKISLNAGNGFLDNRLIAHAGGGIDGYTYTNSLEAIALNYSLGHRVFEMDLNLMPDGNILCSHDIQHLNTITGVSALLPYTKDYRSKKIYNRYTVMDLKDLFMFMSDHTDMYLVTDSKLSDATGQYASNDEYNKQFWAKFVSTARQVDAKVLDRVIPQIYYPAMLEIVEQVYKFSSYIFTLYATALPGEAILRFVFENPRIRAVTMPPGRLEDKVLVDGLRRLGRPIYVHTINNKEDIVQYLRKGVYGFYTDYVTPMQLEKIMNSKKKEGV